MVGCDCIWSIVLLQALPRVKLTLPSTQFLKVHVAEE